VLINGTPEIVLDALNPHEHFVQVPLIARSWSPAAQAVGKAWAELLAPAPNRLIGDGDSSLGQDQLDVAQAQAENVIQPYSLADDFGRKAMAVAWIGGGFILAVWSASTPVRQPGYRDNAPWKRCPRWVPNGGKRWGRDRFL